MTRYDLAKTAYHHASKRPSNGYLLVAKIVGFTLIGSLAVIGAIALVMYLVPLLFFAAVIRYLARQRDRALLR